MAEEADYAAALAAQLAQLRGKFLQRLEGTLATFAAQLSGAGADVPAAMLQDMHAQLHRLAGSGGTFGFTELSRQARTLEVQAKLWLDAGGSGVEPQAWDAWKAGVLGLRQAALAPEAADSAAARVGVRKGTEDQSRLLLVHGDALLGEALQRGLSQFGYQVDYCRDLEQARCLAERQPPDIMVLPIDDDVASQRQAAAGLALLQRPSRRVPVVYLAPHAGVVLQLAAARAGGDDFLALPVDAPTVAARVERLLDLRRQPPYRVLIVDDDEMLAERFQLTLQAAGMLVERVAQPLGVIPRLPDFRPDVLLMDLHMPEYSGAELARAIRYDEAWQSLPIIFLSGESDLDLQHQALGSGGDDFLLKPIPDEQLVAAVLARALRARKVAELMSQDSLTGLLKHASIKDRLAQELERARRQGKPLAVAMVDIDYFKRINDGWGHPMGDQVIKILGHLLRQRVRRQDSVGRYGGEEFLVILPECSAADALRLMDDIRQRFAAVSFQHQGRSFSGTLSAGVASSASLCASQELLADADAALYQAKHGGRNQVVQASVPDAAGA